MHSSQSSEPGGRKPTPGTLGGGGYLCGDVALTSVSSSDSLSDTETSARVTSLETVLVPRDPRIAPRNQRTPIQTSVGCPLTALVLEVLEDNREILVELQVFELRTHFSEKRVG